MIFYWLAVVCQSVLWLFKKPTSQQLSRIKENDHCPVCNHQKGIIRAVVRENRVLCQHTCGICGARWHELPVLKSTTETVWPAVPRDDIERLEERTLPVSTIKKTA